MPMRKGRVQHVIWNPAKRRKGVNLEDANWRGGYRGCILFFQLESKIVLPPQTISVPPSIWNFRICSFFFFLPIVKKRKKIQKYIHTRTGRIEHTHTHTQKRPFFFCSTHSSVNSKFIFAMQIFWNIPYKGWSCISGSQSNVISFQ